MARVTSNVATEHSLNGEKLALLAIFARAEDELFGPAGTLAKYASEGIDVSLVAATRSQIPQLVDEPGRARQRTCACRVSGVRRACLFDFAPAELMRVAREVIEERVVRLIREVRPQVVITFAPEGFRGDAVNRVISDAVTYAFRAAGDSTQFAQHAREGLNAYAAQKLYYCVLPHSLLARWGVTGLRGVPDEQITTTLDVSAQSEVMKNISYCQRQHALDFIHSLSDAQRAEWKTEYYILVESRLRRRARREKDLFAGVR